MQTMMVDYFPRAHTAIAEWLACIMFMLPMKKRLKNWQLGLLYAGVLAVFLVTNQDQAPFLLIILLDILYMMVMIGAGGKLSWTETGYYWAYAFITSEFTASLEWQINYYLIAAGVISPGWQTYIGLLVVCALVYGLVFWINQRKMRSREHMLVNSREMLSAMMIVVAAYLISNFNFAFRDNVFTQLLGAGVLYSRTLVDFGGMVMLFAHDESRREMNLRLELEAMENLLNRQYEQYRQFERNNRTLHRIYHDLKHQLAFIRTEQNEDKRESYLSELVQAIHVYEAEVNTGSSVLDTLLTSKNIVCKENHITMTCFADAHDLGFMDAMDVCAIFGNAIDNAIECEQKNGDPETRLIKVNVYTQNRFLLIRVENYCEEPVNFDSGLPVTTKTDSQMHGYGVKSMKRAIEKYGGHLNLEQEDTWFRITALIPLP
ncbi:MAG: ATP-binding protein [Clostridiales bacterium]|nr:ATP-binding protein [Clostridiales bacterium]